MVVVLCTFVNTSQVIGREDQEIGGKGRLWNGRLGCWYVLF